MGDSDILPPAYRGHEFRRAVGRTEPWTPAPPDPRWSGTWNKRGHMTGKDATTLLREMIRIRIAEETVAKYYPEQEMRTPTHFSIGQEAVSVGVCQALEPTDAAYSGHRCHGEYLAKGGTLIGMFAELYGRVDGCCKGRGGSVHLNAPDVGLIASSAILGETIAAAVGSAWAFKMDGSRRIGVAFFGDGVTEEGIMHECLNFASVMQVPVLFVCGN